jgi:hypothetical protein
VTGTGWPPDAETRYKPLVVSGVKTMMPSAPQEAPRGTRASQMSIGEPPSASMRLSWPWAKKPRDRLSGDQKGQDAPSVPVKAEAFRSNKAIATMAQNLQSSFA